MKTKWRNWKLGLGMSILFAFLSAGATLTDGVHWKALVAVLCTSLLSHLATFFKDHPTDDISFDTEVTTKQETQDQTKP